MRGRTDDHGEEPVEDAAGAKRDERPATTLDRMLALSPRPCPRCRATVATAPDGRCPGCRLALSVGLRSEIGIGPMFVATVFSLMTTGGFGALVMAFLLVEVFGFDRQVQPRIRWFLALSTVSVAAAFVPGLLVLRRPHRLLARPIAWQWGALAYAAATVAFAGVGLGLIVAWA